MPNAQSESESESKSEFPLTLAEVLFEELEPTWADTVKAKTDQRKDPADREKAHAVWEKIHASWDDAQKKINEIKDLDTDEKVVQICQCEGIQIDPSADTPADRIWDCKYELSKKLVPKLHGIIRGLAPKRSALCLSGGGVRSAIFNLGILQGLARCGLLDKFDYLSTVSGGGFIGGWLSAWIHRECGNVGNVAKQLADPPVNPLETEPKPLYNLRVYANYLTPRKGLLSVDTWTLIAVYLRNLLLNWMVFVPALMVILMLPRIWVAFIKSEYLSSQLSFWFLLSVGFIGAIFALVYIGANLPEARTWNFDGRRFVKWCLFPLIVSAMALTTYWLRFPQGDKPGCAGFTVFAVALGVVSWVICLVLRVYARRRDQGADKKIVEPKGSKLRTLSFYALATVLILFAFAVSGLVTWYVTAKQLPPSLSSHVRLYASLAVPLLLILLTIGGTFIAGFTSRLTDVDDQEWWARCGAWILIVVLGWSGFHLVVLLGPTLFVELQDLAVHRNWRWASVKGVATAIVGIVSGLVTVLGGKSAKVPAHSEEGSQAQSKSKLVSIGMPVAAAIFGAFLLIVLALITNWILASSFGEWVGGKLGAPFSLNADDPVGIIHHMPGRVLIIFAALIVGTGGLLGRAINTNRFSLHYYWRNRMMRAYLGATRDQDERAKAKTRNKFTDFDNEDNVHMFQLKQKPLHVVNVTLNLAGGKKLEWQDRKAESFTVSPLHSGSYWLGYRRSEQYALNRKRKGISLATAVAISGAAASPNMGYMMTSPVVRFIMTLFNVRLGFWLGNSGVAGGGNRTTLGKRTFNRDSPTQSVRPIFAEALGMTDDKSPYVYLSDGGHFDNFGLYEMILRRCHFIVVSDASTDTTYCFESLANAIRQVRVDFGVPIEIRHRGKDGCQCAPDKLERMRFGKDADKPNKYCAIFDIRYSCVDKPKDSQESPETYDGVLIYIKPSLNGSEPADVLNYHKSDDAFPEDTIADQWFSESQFESYRMLGSHMIETISAYAADKNLSPFKRFEEQAKLHLGSK